MELVVISAASLAAGGLLGDAYGTAVDNGSIPDALMVKSWASPVVWDMIDRGVVVAKAVQKHSCLPAPRPPLAGEVTPFSGVGHRLQDPSLEDGAAAVPLAVPDSANTPQLTFHYEVEVRDKWAVISEEHVPSFLLENGIAVLSPEQAVAAFRVHLALSMDLQEARVLEEFRLSAADSVHLAPGQATYFLKVNRPFAEYTRDPEAFETTLKRNMLRALGLDPIAAPNMLNFIQILSARPGSVEIAAAIFGCVLVAATVVAAIRAGRKVKVRMPGAEFEARSVRYINHPDGRFELLADAAGWWCTIM